MDEGQVLLRSRNCVITRALWSVFESVLWPPLDIGIPALCLRVVQDDTALVNVGCVYSVATEQSNGRYCKLPNGLIASFVIYDSVRCLGQLNSYFPNQFTPWSRGKSNINIERLADLIKQMAVNVCSLNVCSRQGSQHTIAAPLLSGPGMYNDPQCRHSIFLSGAHEYRHNYLQEIG